MTLVMPRRQFLAGLIGLVAAPAVVRAASLMPVRAFVPMGVDKQYIIYPGGVTWVDFEYVAGIERAIAQAVLIDPRLLGMAR